VLLVILAIGHWQSRNMLAVHTDLSVKQGTLLDLQGQTQSLLAQDKPTLLYFFAPWCQVCSMSIGNLQYLNPEKIHIVTVALDYSSVEQVQEFVLENQVTSSVLLGYPALKQDFNIQGYPSYYLVSQDQKVIRRAFGYSTALGLKLTEVFGG
jgi:thiol-disulfide isomerase/thioredoxin